MKLKIKNNYSIFLFTISTLWSINLYSQTVVDDTTKKVTLQVAPYQEPIIDSSKNVKLLFVPIVFKTPETGWAGGLSGSVSFNTTSKRKNVTRTSVIQLLGMYTQRKQNLQVLDATIYFPEEKYILTQQLSHSLFPEYFWGIGNNTKNKYEERYSFQQYYSATQLKKKIVKNFFVGAIVDFQYVFNINTFNNGGIFDTTFFHGKSDYYVTGVGLSANYDTRDATFWPSKGVFLQSSVTTYNKDVLSNYSFNRVIVDLRYYKQIIKNHILACQFYNYSTIGNTPLRHLAVFGGSNNMRGFYQGRFRDKSLFSAIAEYRAFVFWRLSACLFGGVGDVYNNVKNIQLNKIKGSFGGGIRFALLKDEKLNLRLDYGYSDKYNQGFYFTVAECF